MLIQNLDEFNNFVNVSRETYEKFLIYNNLLTKWQNKMNLIGNSTIRYSMFRHFLDSAQLYKYILKKNGNIIDFGSGAGFPGLVLAIMGLTNVHLVDSNKKKCTFLKEVMLKTNTNITIHNCRIEELEFIYPDYIIARALAPTDKLIEICVKYMKKNTSFRKNKIEKVLPNLLFLKGKNFKSEISNIKKINRIQFEFFQSITNNAAKILYYKSHIV